MEESGHLDKSPLSSGVATSGQPSVDLSSFMMNGWASWHHARRTWICGGRYTGLPLQARHSSKWLLSSARSPPRYPKLLHCWCWPSNLFTAPARTTDDKRPEQLKIAVTLALESHGHTCYRRPSAAVFTRGNRGTSTTGAHLKKFRSSMDRQQSRHRADKKRIYRSSLYCS